VPALLVDYAFDGVSLGWAPELESLPGASAKLCYGRGYQSEIERSDIANGVDNTDMIGIDLVAIDTDPFRAQFQYNRGMDIFDAPIMLSGPFPLAPATNLGDIDWFSLDFMGTKKKVGPGNLNWFASVGLDRATGLGWAGGYVGDGVGTTNLAGRTLADLVLGRDSELVRLPWVGHRSRRWEPEPLRWLGINAGLRMMTAADREEERTGRPSRRAALVNRLLGH